MSIGGIEGFKAVAHPLRVRVLGHLRAHGPATATELAKLFETARCFPWHPSVPSRAQDAIRRRR